jgi:AcrR family transcriptional regulator
MTTEDRPRRRRRTPDTRERIAAAALDLFSSRGFDGASMRELADRLDMTTAALYYHYTDKADILAQLVEPMLEDIERVVADAELVNPDMEERLEHVLDLLLEHRAVFTLLTSDVSARSHAAIAERVEASERMVFRYITGTTGPRDAAAVIRGVAAMGALARPITALSHLEISEHRDLLLDAAASAYNATGRRRRTARATEARKPASDRTQQAVTT